MEEEGCRVEGTVGVADARHEEYQHGNKQSMKRNLSKGEKIIVAIVNEMDFYVNVRSRGP